MAGANGAAPQNRQDGSGKKKSSKQKKQLQQLGIMAGVLVVCAGLVTWTVLLMKDRLSQNQQMTEQDSIVDLMEVSDDDSDDPEETKQTGPAEFTEATTTATSTVSGDETATTTLTSATAPKRVTVQSVSFSKIKTTTTQAQHTASGGKTTAQNGKTTAQNGKTTTTAAKTSANTTTAQTTHTEAQQLTPDSAPTAAQIPYNELLALYLSAQAQEDSAYFLDSAVPTVVLHGSNAYHVISETDDFSPRNWLGGTGGADENPWQTGTSFQIKQYEAGDPYIYYASSGSEYQVIGYYNCRTCDNVWVRMHYYQVGVGWQAEYHIFYSNRPDTQNGSQTELSTGTADAEGLYDSSAAMEQLEKELQGRGMSAGSWGNYKTVDANRDGEALWNKAGSHNNGFAPQSGDTCAVVSGTGNAVMYSAADTSSAAAATLPAGTLLSVPKSALPLGSAMVSVQAKINGTWVSGYMLPEDLIVWNEN